LGGDPGNWDWVWSHLDTISYAAAIFVLAIAPAWVRYLRRQLHHALSLVFRFYRLVLQDDGY